MMGFYADNEIPLLIMLGQSNTDGRGIKSDVPELASHHFDGEVKIYYKPIIRFPASSAINHVNDGFWEDYTGDNGMIVSPQTGTVATSCGPELATAFLWARHCYNIVQKPLYIIKCAIGGTPLANDTLGVDTNWSEDSGQLWELASVYTIRPAITQLLCSGKIPRLIGVFWGQGESDADENRAQYYKQNLETLFDNIRKKSGFSSARIIVMGLSNYNQPLESWNLVKESQIAVVENDNNTVLIRTDGSDNFSPAHRYLPNIHAGDLHYTAIGNASIAEKAFRNYKYEGETYDLCVNDFELIANATQSYASTDLNKLQIDSNSDNAIFTKVSLNSSAGILETYTWLTYPSMLNLNHGNSIFSPRFRLKNFEDAKDQEIIFRIAHDGDKNARPGFVLRAKTACNSPSCCDYNEGILVEIGNGGRKISVSLRQNDLWIAQAPTSFNTLRNLANEQLIWFRIKLKGNILSVDSFCKDSLEKYSPLPSENDWDNIYMIANESFPYSGQTWFALFNEKSGNNSCFSHFHIPVLIANKC